MDRPYIVQPQAGTAKLTQPDLRNRTPICKPLPSIGKLTCPDHRNSVCLANFYFINDIGRLAIAVFTGVIILSDSMKDAICLLLHLPGTLARLAKPGCGRSVIAENLLLKQQQSIRRFRGDG